MRLLIKELEPDSGRILVAGRDIADADAPPGPVLPAQHRRRLPGLQAAAEPHGARQRRLRAPGHRQLAQGDPRQGAGHPAPDGPLHEAPPLPRPALRRRAAARQHRARVRQPPAAAAGRRADRQPRPRDLDRDHAAALPHQPHRARRCSSRRTTTRWSTACAAASSSSKPGRIVRDELAGRYAPADIEHRRVRRAAARARAARRAARATSPATTSTTPSATDEARLLPARGAALDRPQRRPELRGAGLGARDAARARRLHPDRPGDDRRGQRRPRPRARQRLPQEERPAGGRRSACAR